MTIGSTGYIDIAQIALYIFWLFFAGLVFYLHRENKREGYPLERDSASGRPEDRYPVQGFPPMPTPKAFRLHDGRVVLKPAPFKDKRTIQAKPSSRAIGSPLVPTGNPMLDAVGPGSYAERADHPEMTLDGKPLIVPMRSVADFSVAKEDADPRGMGVFGADKQQGGVVTDIWVDQGEPQIRYLEVKVSTGRTVLLPIYFSKIDTRRGVVNVKSILSTQFAAVPALRNPDVVTLLEEDKICAYYAGGTLYATAARAEPLI